MNEGRIEQVGSPKDVYYGPKTPFVSGFFGDSNLIDGVMGADGVVETPLGIVATAEKSLPGGTPVRLAVRPEKIDMVKEAVPGRISWQGRIEEVIFVAP
jgi:spermidine/putrescine transport system ATP-binding protein